jgi:polar amino acid transport system substrate-binding protein
VSVVRWLLLLVPLFVLACAAPAQAQPDSLRVATRIVRPFVFEQDGRLTGFSIELWEAIAPQLGVRTTYVIKNTLRELLEAPSNDESDLAISAISITEERELRWDFSQPMFEAGLQVLTPAEGYRSGMSGAAGALMNPGFLPTMGFVIITALLAGHVIWFFERSSPGRTASGRRYFPGVLEATLTAPSAFAARAETGPKHPASRAASLLWTIIAVACIAYLAPTITSTLTAQQLRRDIRGPDDLPGRRVATVRNSTAAGYLAQRNLPASEFTNVEDAIRSVERGRADAVVYDAPVLRYYATNEGKGKVQVVGAMFRRESYGIQFPAGSPLREPVNEALLRLRENGTYDRLMTKWFGEEDGKPGS